VPWPTSPELIEPRSLRQPLAAEWDASCKPNAVWDGPGQARVACSDVRQRDRGLGAARPTLENGCSPHQPCRGNGTHAVIVPSATTARHPSAGGLVSP
jgi:hypothetical protein